jgi:hypothetical protein
MAAPEVALEVLTAVAEALEGEAVLSAVAQEVNLVARVMNAVKNGGVWMREALAARSVVSIEGLSLDLVMDEATGVAQRAAYDVSHAFTDDVASLVADATRVEDAAAMLSEVYGTENDSLTLARTLGRGAYTYVEYTMQAHMAGKLLQLAAQAIDDVTGTKFMSKMTAAYLSALFGALDHLVPFNSTLQAVGGLLMMPTSLGASFSNSALMGLTLLADEALRKDPPIPVMYSVEKTLIDPSTGLVVGVAVMASMYVVTAALKLAPALNIVPDTTLYVIAPLSASDVLTVPASVAGAGMALVMTDSVGTVVFTAATTSSVAAGGAIVSRFDFAECGAPSGVYTLDASGLVTLLDVSAQKFATVLTKSYATVTWRSDGVTEPLS